MAFHDILGFPGSAMLQSLRESRFREQRAWELVQYALVSLA